MRQFIDRPLQMTELIALRRLRTRPRTGIDRLQAGGVTVWNVIKRYVATMLNQSPEQVAREVQRYRINPSFNHGTWFIFIRFEIYSDKGFLNYVSRCRFIAKITIYKAVQRFPMPSNELVERGVIPRLQCLHHGQVRVHGESQELFSKACCA